MKNEKNLISEYYIKRANEYEDIYKKPERQEDLSKLKNYLQSIFADSNVLEIACGTGYWTQVISSVCNSITAVDLNEEVLRIAKSKLYTKNNARFISSDAYSLNEIYGKYNAAFAGFWLSHIPKNSLNDFLQNLHKKLETDSLVCFIDNRYIKSSSTPIAYYDEYGNSYQLRILKDGREYSILKNFPSNEELKNLFLTLGKEITIIESDYYWLLTYRI